MLKFKNIKRTLTDQCLLISTILIVILAGINCQVDSGTGDMNSGVKYTVTVRRIEQTVAPSRELVYFYYQISDDQPIIYYKTVSADAPMTIEAVLQTNDDILYDLPFDKMSSVCESYPPQSFEANIIKILEPAIMNGSSCPIPSGTTYLMPVSMPGVTLTFDQQLPCGDYSLTLNLYDSDNNWGAQMGFSWELTEDTHDCESSE